MFGGDLGSTALLAYGPANTAGGLRYAYLGTPGLLASPLSYADLSACFGFNATAFTSGLSFNQRLYFGFTGATPLRAGLIKLSTRPSSPGLNAVTGVDCLDLGAGSLQGSPSTTAIDALGAFGDRLYLASASGWYRSTTADPRSAAAFPQDWVEVTPSATQYSARTSLVSAKTTALTPADLSVPHFAAFRGRLFAGRNTSAGPQLWSCAPELSGSATDCDPGDWRLIAPNSVSDTLLSQFNAPEFTALSLVEATPNFLYVGFDSPQGFHLFRTDNPDAAARADFRGAGSCNAGQHPASCDALAGPGLGDSSNRALFSETPFRSFSGNWGLVLSIGGPGRPPRIYRFDD
jgi:hypothetical protein